MFAASAQAESIQSKPSLNLPEEIWSDFDPQKAPIEERILKQWSEANITYKEFYLSGMIENEPVTIYGVYAAPHEERKLPAVLHLHGHGQTVTLPWLQFWTRRGFAALSINWEGKGFGHSKFTLYGDKNLSKYSTYPEKYLLWAKTARIALTYLENQPEVDAEKLGAFGISMGGSLMWYLAFDERIKAGCAMYGVVADYAPKVKFPMLFLSATNDRWGAIGDAYEVLNALPSTTFRRQAFTPYFSHHVGQELSENLPRWMDTWLKNPSKWPQTPAVKVRLSQNGVPFLKVRSAGQEKIDRVSIYYAIENTDSAVRHWRFINGLHNGDSWTGSMPVMDVKSPLFAFANVHYKSGICLSSNMETVIPSELGDAVATDKRANVIYKGSQGVQGWATNSASTCPYDYVPTYLQPAMGPAGKKGFSVYHTESFQTHKLGDPKWKGPQGAQLSFEVLSRHNQTFKVSVKAALNYSCSVNIIGTGQWELIVMPVSKFKEGNSGKSLKHWDKLTTLVLERPEGGWADKNIMFTDFSWLTSDASEQKK